MIDGNQGDKGFLAFAPFRGESQEDLDKVARNMERYSYRAVGERDAHQVMCYDKELQKNVWGTYQAVSTGSRERIFVPNQS